MTLELLPQATLEVAEAVSYYESQRTGLGVRFADELELAYRELVDGPERWAFLAPGFRRRSLRHFPYGVVFAVKGTLIVVVAVMYLRRDPDYWKERLTGR
jgi:plasmid stabilization system protein ParE